VAKIIYSTKGQSVYQARTTHLLVTEEFEQGHPELVQRFVNVVLKEHLWDAEEKNRDQVLQFWAQSGIPYTAFKQDFEGDTFRVRLSPLIDDYVIAHYKEAAESALKYKLVRKPIDVDSWFETKYLRQGLKDLKLAGFWQERDAKGLPKK
jgi:sulfonate transport system substrate-binding protein